VHKYRRDDNDGLAECTCTQGMISCLARARIACIDRSRHRLLYIVCAMEKASSQQRPQATIRWKVHCGRNALHVQWVACSNQILLLVLWRLQNASYRARPPIVIVELERVRCETDRADRSARIPSPFSIAASAPLLLAIEHRACIWGRHMPMPVTPGSPALS
jgi:hypothetical protein